MSNKPVDNKIEILKWDSEFFGFKVARVISFAYAESLKTLLKKEGVELAYFESPERIGGLGKEISIKNTYSILLLKEIKGPDSRSRSYPQTEDWKKLKELAILAGKHSRFHRDARIPPEKFKQLYELWAQYSVSRKFAHDVFIYEVKNQIVGLITLKYEGENASVGLIAVSGDKQGLGIGSQLLQQAKTEAKTKNCTFLKVVTQKDNTPACELYTKNGFSLESTQYQYHIWAD